MTDILRETALAKNEKFIGKKCTVLIDNNKGANWSGKNGHYKTVRIKSNKKLMGKFVRVKITEALAWSLKGEL